MTEKYLMLDINNPKATEIAETLSNATCKKILNLLAEKELSESDIAQALKLPLNTIDYNIKKLESAGLIEKSKSFFWSVKGKKIPTYKLSNKKILISPKTSFRGFLPAIFGSLIIATGIKLYTSSQQLAQQAIQYTAPAAEKAITAAAEPSVSNIIQPTPEIWPWFLLGALTAILIILIYNMKGGSK